MTYNNILQPEHNGFGQNSIVTNVAENLWIIENAFDKSTLQWLQQIVTNTENQFQVTRPHNRLSLLPSEDYNRIQQLGLDLIPKLNSITDQDLNFMIAKYWLDLPGFGCQIHHDADDILVTFQCYLNHDGNTVGAEFLHSDPSIQIPIETNSGYINLNTDLKKHQVISGVGTRQSIAFQYNQNVFV